MSRIENPFKTSIQQAFDQSAPHYHEAANVQRQCAERLIASLKPWINILPPGPVLEIGCGTGFLTDGLVDLLPDRQMLITDLSSNMVDICERRYLEKHPGQNGVAFSTLDAEDPNAIDRKYALITHNFAAQWFRDTAYSMGGLLDKLRPGGIMLAALPGNDSFPEWKLASEVAGVPFTANKMPETEELVVKLSMGPHQVDYYEDTVTDTFDSALDFFRHLKTIGAHTDTSENALDRAQFKALIDAWNSISRDKVKVSYHVIFVAVKKEFQA